MRHALPSAIVTDEIPGFPERFPVRDDGVRTLALPRGLADLPGLAARILRSRAPARSHVEISARGAVAGGVQPPQQHRPLDLRRLWPRRSLLHVQARAVQQPDRRRGSSRAAIASRSTAARPIAGPCGPRSTSSPAAAACSSSSRARARPPRDASRRSRGRVPRAPIRGVDPARRRLGYRSRAPSGPQVPQARADRLKLAPSSTCRSGSRGAARRPGGGRPHRLANRRTASAGLSRASTRPSKEPETRTRPGSGEDRSAPSAARCGLGAG